MYIYCLFCESGKSRFAAGAATALFECRAIVPKRIQHTWSQGRMINRIRDLLPGYLFVYSEDPIRPAAFRRIPDVIRCLRTTDYRYELTGTDEAFALFLLETGGIVGKTQVVRDADGRLEIAEDAFKGANVRILKVDRRAERMQIEIRLAREPVRTWVEYEVVEENGTPEEHPRVYENEV